MRGRDSLLTSDGQPESVVQKAGARADRLVSLYLGYPIAKVLRRDAPLRIPILMYHGIREGTGAQHPYFETNTSPVVFARHMKFLREHGYTAVSIPEGLKALESGDAGKKRVVITFDDGFRDFYTAAFPILTEYGFSATMFLPTGLVQDQKAPWHGADLMTWPEVRELHAHGIHFGSHTVSHGELKFMDFPQIDYEVGQSKRTLEEKLGSAIGSFAYPYAFPEHQPAFTQRLGEMLESHGYENGVSTIIGRARSCHNRFFLPRLPVNTWDDLRFFQAKLEGGYDWLHFPQRTIKALKNFIRPEKAVTDRKSTVELRSS